MREPRGQELINRYKKNYHIPVDADVTEDMILRHWELEKRLTKELLESNSKNRWEVFERCYSQLYGELEWLNRIVDADTRLPPSKAYRNWLYLIGQPPKRIYEIGSGKGKMISFLASCGFKCTATEITRERGQKHVSERSNLSWSISDGVHLGRFELTSYDVVISNYVIEHLHPDDLLEHFEGVQSILQPGGRYIFTAPHRYIGPSDISKVFKCAQPIGMHLKEYTHQEIKALLQQSGFKDVRAVLSVPNSISRLLRLYFRPRASRAYLSYLCGVERLISLLPHYTLKQKVAYLAIVILFYPGIFLIAQKNLTNKE